MAANDEASAFTRIGDCVYLQKPREVGGHGVSSEGQPDLILVFGWMGAKLPHLLKYCKTYDEIYPNARKILVRAPATVFFSTDSRKRANLMPAVEALEAMGYVPAKNVRKQKYGAPLEPLLVKPSPRILVHAFSNGGCWQLSILSRLLHERFKGVEVEPAPSAVILDSCPSNGGIKETQKAFTTAIRNPILKRLASWLITFLLLFGWFMRKLGSEPPLDVMKRTLNQPNLLPWFSKATARLYIYSRTDELMPPADVEGHAELAKRNGLKVEMEKYDESPHVAHARTDPVRYWGAVKRFWEAALQSTF